MRVIAFDAAYIRTGVAYIKAENPRGKITTNHWHTEVLDVQGTKKLMEVLRTAQDNGVTHAAIEDCYLGYGNVLTLKRLQEAQTRIKVACEQAGLTVLPPVMATVWQSNYSITGPSEDRKRGSKVLAKMLGGRSNLSQDECDAICLCDYAQRNGCEND